MSAPRLTAVTLAIGCALRPAHAVDVRAQSPEPACRVAIERDAAGTPTVMVAAYLTGRAGALRVSKRGTDGTFRAIAESAVDLGLAADQCELSRHDFDGDGDPELLLSLITPRVESALVFEWTGGQLAARPVNDPREDARRGFDYPRIVDLDLRGPEQIATLEPEGPYREPQWRVWRLDGERWAEDRRTLAVVSFGLNDRRLRETLPTVVGGGPYVVRVVNGTREGTRRATSVVVLVGGVTVIPAGHVVSDTQFHAVDLDPQTPARAVLDARIEGPADASVVVVLERPRR